MSPLERTLEMVSRISGNPDALDVKLALRDGLTYLGPLPIGPAPYFYLR
jgi:hypothetical protein